MNEFVGSGAAPPAAPEGGGGAAAPAEEQKIKVVGIKTRYTARPVFHRVDDLRLRVGDRVMTESPGGEEDFGEVAESPRVMDARFYSDPLPRVVGRAGEEQDRRHGRTQDLEQKALEVCRQKIADMKLPMRLVDVKYAFSHQKAIFYFSAEGRVDFRKLVRSLSDQLSIRVEMRQIGVRDEAGMRGGCGDCGRTYCCSSYLKSFDPISVRMAKDQNLSLNPSKLSGGCGRLKCCLRFEHSHYLSVKKRLPACKKKVGGCTCTATVIRQDLLKEEITLALESGERMTVRADELTRMTTGQFTLKNPMEGAGVPTGARHGGRE